MFFRLTTPCPRSSTSVAVRRASARDAAGIRGCRGRRVRRRMVSEWTIQYAESYCASDGCWTTAAYDHLLSKVCRVLWAGGSCFPQTSWNWPGAKAQRTMGGIREDYVVGFAGPRPQEVDCGPWLIALYYQQSPIIFEMSAPTTARRMRAFGYAIPRLFIARATRKPPFSTRHSSSTSTVTSAPMRSASNSAQDRCAALCLRGCFRHQLLLCRQRHRRLIDNDQDCRLSRPDFLRYP